MRARSNRRKPPASNEEGGAYLEAVTRLARRDHPLAELKELLLADGLAAAEVEDALARLVRERFVDDGRTAERAASRGLARGLGKRRITGDLARRGVAVQTAREGFARAAEDLPEEAVIDRVARSWWSRHRTGEGRERAQRLCGFLMRRGHPPALVVRRVKALWPQDAAELDESDLPADDDVGE